MLCAKYIEVILFMAAGALVSPFDGDLLYQGRKKRKHGKINQTKKSAIQSVQSRFLEPSITRNSR